jgi:hypothetical protein
VATITCSGAMAWGGSLDMDMDGNFMYIGGGVEFPSSSGANGKVVASGFMACVHLGAGVSGAGTQGGMMMVNSATTGSPVQELRVRGSDILTGSPQPLLNIWHASTLGNICMPCV